MKRKSFSPLIAICLSCLLWLGITSCSQSTVATEVPAEEINYFPSWTADSPTKNTIIEFVEDVTTPGNANFVAESDRIAVFDNDGTLWSEYPLPTQIYFLQSHGNGRGETTEDYIAASGEFVTKQDSAEFESPYVDLIYEPMVELLDYLRHNKFQIYICSGGEIDFMRSFAEEYYGIPPQNLVGSAFTTTFDDENYDPPALVRSDVLVQPFNDEGGKPVGIERYIGKKPIMAVGNANGDLQMLEYTDDHRGNDLMMLVRHDDETREHYQEAADDDHVNDVLDAANQNGWTLISVKDDFAKVFLGTDLP